MFIRQYDHNYLDRNKAISFSKQALEGINFNNPSPSAKQPNDEIVLSKENQNLADQLTKLTIKMFSLEADKKELKQDAGKINAGLEYFI